MMQELYIDTRTVEDAAGTDRQFDYYVLIGEIDTGPFFCESYGVKIAQHGADNTCSVANITTSAARIDSLVELLLTHRVTPCGLNDVIADWL